MMKMVDMVSLLLIGTFLLALAGCSDRSEPLPVIAAPAVLRDWSPQEECALAQNLAKYPTDSVMWTLHDDWARMRRELGLKTKPSRYKCTEPNSIGSLA